MFVSHVVSLLLFFFFFFNDTATTEIYTLSLHDALPISRRGLDVPCQPLLPPFVLGAGVDHHGAIRRPVERDLPLDRKSTRLNSSHSQISYAVFCLKKKKKAQTTTQQKTTPYTRNTSASA